MTPERISNDKLSEQGMLKLAMDASSFFILGKVVRLSGYSGCTD
jgi:hypothetical protein